MSPMISKAVQSAKEPGCSKNQTQASKDASSKSAQPATAKSVSPKTDRFGDNAKPSVLPAQARSQSVSGSAAKPVAAGNAGNAGNADNAGNAGKSGGYGQAATAAPLSMAGSQEGSATGAGSTVPGQTGIAPELPGANGLASSGDIDRNIDFTEQSLQERTAQGLSDRDRGIIHLWGRQVISRGFNDGGIYSNVLDTEPAKFTQAERELITELRARERATFGTDTGKELDREFFTLMQRMNPEEQIDVSRWMNAPVRASQGPVDIVNDIDTLSQRTGLSAFEQSALRLWGHEPLMNGGTIDGSILAYTIGNDNALDGRVHSQGNAVDAQAATLLQADLMSDGVRNGDTLKGAFRDVLDKIYLGGPGTSEQQVVQQATQTAAANGRSMGQIMQDVRQGFTQAMSDAAGMVKDHPIITTVGVGGMAAATAVCPFLGGMGAGAAGIAAGANMMRRHAQAS